MSFHTPGHVGSCWCAQALVQSGGKILEDGAFFVNRSSASRPLPSLKEHRLVLVIQNGPVGVGQQQLQGASVSTVASATRAQDQHQPLGLVVPAPEVLREGQVGVGGNVHHVAILWNLPRYTQISLQENILHLPVAVQLPRHVTSEDCAFLASVCAGVARVLLAWSSVGVRVDPAVSGEEETGVRLQKQWQPLLLHNWRKKVKNNLIPTQLLPTHGCDGCTL
mmetsp:Transcript_2747/g.5534  ORF Transcript_2747/g.5534 Transcript_2747/m.5534 type:complete len:222 (-) Transcript_2747:12-677(-)